MHRHISPSTNFIYADLKAAHAQWEYFVVGGVLRVCLVYNKVGGG